MANDKSLISLALIKTNWEKQKKDYVDMFIPFVLYSISDLEDGEIASIVDTRSKIKDEFGIDIYNNVLEIFFKRIASKQHYEKPYLTKKKGIYYRTAQTINVQAFEQKRQEYSNSHNNAIKTFLDFLNSKSINFDPKVAQTELISYLCKYGNDILQDKVLTPENNIWTKRVGEFIEYSINSNTIIINYLKDIAKGGMLSTVYFNNSFEIKPSQKFKNTAIYFDTPLLMYILGYSGDALQKTVQELLDLLLGNGAKVYAFEHNLSELESILEAYVLRYRNGTLNTSYNFDYLIENDVKPEKIETDIPSLRMILKEKGIVVKEKPPYDEYWKTIGFTNFDQYLSENIHYNKDTRRDNDVESIAAIYRLRSRQEYHKYETCEAIFVATNSYLVYHTQKYFKEIEHRKGIPAIVDDTFLTSLLWLKNSNCNDSLPTLKLIADALSAQEPSKKFWDSFNDKVDELRERDEITDDELIELKYGLFSKKNMFEITEGDVNKINHDTVREVQKMNFRVQHKEVIEEKNKAINEKNQAITERDKYAKKYIESQTELIKTKAQNYISKIKKRKKILNFFILALICVAIYLIIDTIGQVFGVLAISKIAIKLELTAVFFALGQIINLFIDKLISNQLDIISMHFINKYINKIYDDINNNEESMATDIISYINKELEKGI